MSVKILLKLWRNRTFFWWPTNFLETVEMQPHLKGSLNFPNQAWIGVDIYYFTLRTHGIPLHPPINMDMKQYTGFQSSEGSVTLPLRGNLQHYLKIILKILSEGKLAEKKKRVTDLPFITHIVTTNAFERYIILLQSTKSFWHYFTILTNFSQIIYSKHWMHLKPNLKS